MHVRFLVTTSGREITWCYSKPNYQCKFLKAHNMCLEMSTLARQQLGGLFSEEDGFSNSGT